MKNEVNIYNLREHAGAVAAVKREGAAGVSNVHIMRIEKGETEPTFNKLVAILDALDTSMYSFLKAVGYTRPGKVGGRRGLEPRTR